MHRALLILTIVGAGFIQHAHSVKAHEENSVSQQSRSSSVQSGGDEAYAKGQLPTDINFIVASQPHDDGNDSSKAPSTSSKGDHRSKNVTSLKRLLSSELSFPSENSDSRKSANNTVSLQADDAPSLSGSGSFIPVVENYLGIPPMFAGMVTPLLMRVDVGALLERQLARMLHVENSTVPLACVEDLKVFFSGVFEKEPWALQMLDAMGKPGRGLLRGHTQWWGNYDLCVNVSHAVRLNATDPGREVKGSYYVVAFQLPPELIDTIVSRDQQVEGLTDQPLTWHLCLPSSCPAQELNATYFNYTPGFGVHLNSIENRDPIRFDFKDPVAVTSIVITGCLGLLVVAATIYDVIQSWSREKKAKAAAVQKRESTPKRGVANAAFESDGGSLDPKKPPEPAYANVNGTTEVTLARSDDVTEGHREVPVLGKLLLAWSLPGNAARVTNQRLPPDNLACLHGIRVLSITWLILGQSIKLLIPRLENGLDALPLLKNFWFQIMMNTAYSADTFFVLSGVLTGYLFLREATEHGRVTRRQMAHHYLHRLCRLSPTYLLVLLLYVGLTPQLGSGPTRQVQEDTRNCHATWWTNVLYVNNLVHTSQRCMEWTWFLAASMQFHVIAPLVLVPLVYKMRIKVLGFIVLGLLQVTHIGTQSYLVYTKWDHLRLGTNDEIERVILPYTRVSPYATGLLVGFVLNRAKCKIKLNKIALCLGWLICLGLALVCLLVTYDDVNGQPWTLSGRTAFESLHRPLWGLVIAWVILACCTGHGGWVNTFLSWEGWLPYSKLTYGVFLFHVIVIEYIYQIHRKLYFYTVTTVFYRWMGLAFLCYVFSFVVAMLAELPFLAVERVLFRKRRP